MPVPEGLPHAGAVSREPRDAAKSARKGAALCLSGGGFRATLFHLGALRRLNECGLLGWFDRIATVSGGSVTAAHVARRVSPWPAIGQVFPDWETTVSAPLRAFCGIDIRTPAVWQGVKNPARTWKNGGVPSAMVEEAFRRFIHPGSLSDLPERPNFVFQSTDVDGATLFRFERHRVVYRGKPHDTRPTDSIARAVAASACFPPVFAPVVMDPDPTRFSRNGEDAGVVVLADGGLYDNLGLQPVIQHHQHILISDAGSPYDYAVKARGMGKLLGHYSSVLMRQIQSLRMREWISLRDNRHLAEARRISGAWWSLGLSKAPTGDEDHTSAPGPRPVGYPADFLEDFVVKCRTDFNAFTDVEARVLENAGYMNCAIALHDRFPPPEGVAPYPPVQWPHPLFSDPVVVAPDLADISERMPNGLLNYLLKMLTDHQLPSRLPY